VDAADEVGMTEATTMEPGAAVKVRMRAERRRPWRDDDKLRISFSTSFRRKP